MPGEDTITKYKTIRVPLKKVLLQSIDRRAISGLRNKVNVLLASDKAEKKNEGALLNNYAKIVAVAEELADDSKVMMMDDQQLTAAWKMVKDEIDEIPEKLLESCLRRKVSPLRQQGGWQAMVDATCLFPSNPESLPKVADNVLTVCMAHLSSPLATKLRSWERFVFKDCLEVLIAEGAPRLPHVEALVSALLPAYSEDVIDYLELEEEPALVLSTSVSVWKGVLALCQGNNGEHLVRP